MFILDYINFELDYIEFKLDYLTFVLDRLQVLCNDVEFGIWRLANLQYSAHRQLHAGISETHSSVSINCCLFMFFFIPAFTITTWRVETYLYNSHLASGDLPLQ